MLPIHIRVRIAPMAVTVVAAPELIVRIPGLTAGTGIPIVRSEIPLVVVQVPLVEMPLGGIRIGTVPIRIGMVGFRVRPAGIPVPRLVLGGV